MNKKYQVFVSSTQEDLQEERNAVVTALHKDGYIPLCMEYFTASNRTQWEVIESIIPECDYYVVIVAGKYGSIEETSQKSYTQKEYELAIRSGIPCLGFIYKDIENLPLKKTEADPIIRQKLDAFRKTVKSQMCSFWTNKDDLAASVVTALHRQVFENPRVGWIRSNSRVDQMAYQALQEDNDRLRDKILKLSEDRKTLLVYGVSETSTAIATKLESSSFYSVVGYLTDKRTNASLGKPIYIVYNNEQLKEHIERISVRYILFPDEAIAKKKQSLIEFCFSCGVKPLIFPAEGGFIDKRKVSNILREIRIDDLMGRDSIRLDVEDIVTCFKNKTVMVTGAAGSIGSELCRQVASFGAKELILFDNAESPMHGICLDLNVNYSELTIVPIIGDVREISLLDYAFQKYKPQIVFHSAAYKHVPMMEQNPCEATYVNVTGTRNVADKCLEYSAEKMILISPASVIAPTNVMTCTKRLAEIYVQSLGLAIERGTISGKTSFVIVRFGSVLGSNGSVLTLFRHQIEQGGPVTVTHPYSVRYFMTISEACSLVLEAASISNNSQTFILNTGTPVNILDLAVHMIKLAGLEPYKDIEIQYTGLRLGEKLYEESVGCEDVSQTQHERILRAKGEQYDYEHALEVVNNLTKFAIEVNVSEMIKLMKAVVPGFKSINSPFEIYDK